MWNGEDAVSIFTWQWPTKQLSNEKCFIRIPRPFIEILPNFGRDGIDTEQEDARSAYVWTTKFLNVNYCLVYLGNIFCIFEEFYSTTMCFANNSLIISGVIANSFLDDLKIIFMPVSRRSKDSNNVGKPINILVNK